MRRYNQFTIKICNEIKKLYWNEGYDYQDLGTKFKCDPSSIGRVIHDVIKPVEFRRLAKKIKYSPNFKPSANEPKNAKTLRCMRDTLPSTKLNVDAAKDIRTSYFNGTNSQVELAHKYKVNQSTVCKIITGKDWKICKC